MDLGVIYYERKIYTVFDTLSEVGGLYGIIVVFFQSVVSLWNYNSFDNYMISRLFKI